VTVRDPTASSGRLTWWNSRTDGKSPDGRSHAVTEAPQHVGVDGTVAVVPRHLAAD
jgi:hypothetical protein